MALPLFALDALRAEDRRDGPVIADRDGRPDPRAGRRAMARPPRPGRARGAPVHDLRGTYATLALARGVAPKALADVLGHDPAVLLRTYAGPIENGGEAIAAAIGEALR